jgi:hypothetical protein
VVPLVIGSADGHKVAESVVGLVVVEVVDLEAVWDGTVGLLPDLLVLEDGSPPSVDSLHPGDDVSISAGVGHDSFSLSGVTTLKKREAPPESP